MNTYITISDKTKIIEFSIIIILIISYTMVICEEYIKIKKSKPMIMASSIIWFLISIIAIKSDETDIFNKILKSIILEYSELFLFLLVAMTYINIMKDRNIFEVLKIYLINKQLSYRKLFWITGLMSFFLSPVIDNLTTSLIMCSILLSIGKNNKNFINISCINIVIAANAGGAFSPFGDITTLMVWQNNLIKFTLFFKIFLPSFVSFMIPSIILSIFIENKIPKLIEKTKIKMKSKSKQIVISFILTIIISIIFHNYFCIPSAIGMMTGLSFLQLIEIFSKKEDKICVYNQIKNIEWDTLFFFYGIILCVGGLNSLGYLNTLSIFIYEDLGKIFNIGYKETSANILIGLVSAVIDNIPTMYAVINMKPNMNEGQWLLVTLTTGTGGSLFSIGSAAGIAIMGQTKNIYTFFSHLKWTGVILIGYICGIITHIIINNFNFY